MLFRSISDTTQTTPDVTAVDVSGWSAVDTTLYRLAQKYADSGFDGKVQVAFRLTKDFSVEAKEVVEKLEPDGFLASFRQKGTVTVEKEGTVITLSGL